MQIDPYSPEGRAFLADYIEGGGTLEDAIHDELIACEICGLHFTDWDKDFDHSGEDRMCWECSEDPENAPYDLAKHEGTYR